MTNTHKPRRKPCPINCPCLCHDTGGGVQEFHPVGGGPCAGKSGLAAVQALRELSLNAAA